MILWLAWWSLIPLRAGPARRGSVWGGFMVALAEIILTERRRRSYSHGADGRWRYWTKLQGTSLLCGWVGTSCTVVRRGVASTPPARS